MKTNQTAQVPTPEENNPQSYAKSLRAALEKAFPDEVIAACSPGQPDP